MRKTINSKSVKETEKFAKDVAVELKGGGLVLLFGDLGSGKTAFVKGLAHAIGIEKFSVKSPTYTYIRHYNLKSANFYHIDLYRLDGFDELLAEEIIELCHEKENIVIIEWADKIDFGLPKAKSEISFKYLAENQRQITVTSGIFQKPPVNFDANFFYQKYRTPPHVIRHCKKVAWFAEKLAKEFVKKGYMLDIETIVDAANVHDALRVCDFRDFDEKNFPDISKVDLEIWKELRRKYGKIGHAKAMGDILVKMGESSIANMVYKHDFNFVTKLETLDEKILYYADKRVNMDKVVSLKKRLKAGKERNLTGKSKSKERSDIVEKIYRLEAELSKLLGKDLAKMR